jgi:hypothetical protein
MMLNDVDGIALYAGLGMLRGKELILLKEAWPVFQLTACIGGRHLSTFRQLCASPEENSGDGLWL